MKSQHYYFVCSQGSVCYNMKSSTQSLTVPGAEGGGTELLGEWLLVFWKIIYCLRGSILAKWRQHGPM